MKIGINANNIEDIEKIIKEWLASDEKELILEKIPTSLNINVIDEIKVETKMV